MQQNNIIILVKEQKFETWGSLTELCKAHNFSYNYLKQKQFPFEYKGIKFYKIPYRTKLITQY